MFAAAGYALTFAVQALLGSSPDPGLVRCRSVAHNGDASIEIVQTRRVSGHAKGSPHACHAKVATRGPSSSMQRVYADIDPVGDHFGVAILPEMIGRFRGVAKLGDYDGRLLLVDVGGGVVDLPGPGHFLAYGRLLLVQHRSDVYGIVVYDLEANELVFAANDAVLAALLGTPVGDPPRWLDLDGTIYLAPVSDSTPAPALRVDKDHGGLIPSQLSADELGKAKPVHFLGLEGWQDCSCALGAQ